MHELPITQNIVDIAVRHGQQANAKQVTDIYLVIGQLSSVFDESVQFYWDMISKGTICEGAKLHFEYVPATLFCNDCKQDYKLKTGELAACPTCVGFNVKITGGKEFRVQAINVEQQDQDD